MIKPNWAVNGVFALIALVLIAVDVNQRHHSMERHPASALTANVAS